MTARSCSCPPRRRRRNNVASVRPARFHALLLLPVLLAGAAAPTRASSAPDWMRAQAVQPMPAHDDKTDAVLLYSETVLTVLGEGRMRRVDRRVYRILRPGGESLGLVKLYFDPQSRITDLHGWCIPASGKEYEVKERDAAESAYIGQDGGLLVSDERTKLLRIPAATPGNVIGYEVEQDLRPYQMADEWDFEDTVPVREARYVLQLPAGWGYRAAWINHEPVSPQPGAAGQQVWTVGDLKAVRIEERMPPWRGVHGRLFVTPVPPNHEPGFQTWDAVGGWMRDLARDRRVATADIQHKVAELTANAPGPLAKAQALARYVQTDIRYVGIELGIAQDIERCVGHANRLRKRHGERVGRNHRHQEYRTNLNARRLRHPTNRLD